MSRVHLQEEILRSPERVVVNTQYGPVRGGRAANGAQVYLGELCFRTRTSRVLTTCSEVPYALNPRRFHDPEPLPSTFRYEDKDYVYESSCECHITSTDHLLKMCVRSSTTAERRTICRRCLGGQSRIGQGNGKLVSYQSTPPHVSEMT